MNIALHYRFEGSVFFVYDHNVLKKEEDLLEDAIIYFYPHSMPLDNQCLLCGQLMGLVQFSHEMLGSSPVLYRFKKEKIAVKHVGQYTFALAGSNTEPDSILIRQLDRLYGLFSFYHGSVDMVKSECNNNKEMFLSEMRSLWEQYLAFIRNYGDHLPSVFNNVPYLAVKDTTNSCFLKAAHFLQTCQRRPQVIAGCILYNRFILCSQLLDSISRCLLLLKPNQHHHPAIPLDPDFPLPIGVRLFSVYVEEDDWDTLLKNNENSPYKREISQPSKCCCKPKRTSLRRKHPSPSEVPRAYVSSHYDSGRDSMVPSEQGLLCSSVGLDTENSTTLCKAVLEDLILKGFKCCKCVDDVEGELDEGSFCENSVEDMAGDVEKRDGIPQKGNEDTAGRFSERLPDEDDMSFDKITVEEVQEASEFEERVALSRQSIRTLEGESGIEVTCSDFQSSTATPFEQMSGGTRDFHAGSQDEHEISKKQTRKRVFQHQVIVGDERPTVSDFGDEKDLDLLQGTFRSSEESPDHIECKGLDDDLEDVENQHFLENDSRPHEVPREGHAVGSDDSKGSKEIIDVEAHNKSSSYSLDDNHGSVTIPRDNLESEKVHGAEKGSEHSCDGNKGSPMLPRNEDLLGESLEDDHGSPEMPEHDEEQSGNSGSQVVTDAFPSEKERNPELSGDDSPVAGKQDDFNEFEKNLNKDGDENKQDDHGSDSKCCGVDGLVHANLFVQAHSEIVLILLTECNLQRNEDVIKSLWSVSLRELGELDMLLRQSSKASKEGPQVPYNYLIYDNFEKTMSGNLKEPVFAVDHVFCETTKILHAHFGNAPQLVDVTLGNSHTGIYGRRTLSKEVYFQENMVNPLTSQRHQPQDACSYLEKRVRERLWKDHGLHLL